MFSKKVVQIDVLKDIVAIEEFLADVHADEEKLLLDLKELYTLEEEFAVAKDDLLKTNLESQGKIFDDLMQRYEFFQNDVDINGIRLKMMAEQFLRNAEESGLKDLAKEKKKIWINL